MEDNIFQLHSPCIVYVTDISLVTLFLFGKKVFVILKYSRVLRYNHLYNSIIPTWKYLLIFKYYWLETKE